MENAVDFKALLNEKLAAMAQEVSELFDRMIEQHEREKQVLNQTITRQQQLLDALAKRPHVVLHRSDAQILSHCQVEADHRLDEETESLHIKEEQEELSIKEEPEKLQELTQPPELLVKSEDEEDKPIAIFSDSLEKTSTLSVGSDEQSHVHSNNVENSENFEDLEDETENTEDLSTSPPGFESISGHDLSESEAQTQVSSDTEDSDEWSPEPQPGRAQKRLVLKSRFRNKLKNKNPLDGKSKRNKSVNKEGSEVIFECTQCQKTFLRKNCSVRNPSVATTRCSACSARLKQGNVVHRVTVHKQGKHYVCKVCQKSFTRPDNLSSHMLIHTGERPHCCTVCKKTFKEPGHLKAHIIIHTGEKPFSCAICKNSFAHRATRDRHERNHQGKRPFSCSDCGANFKQHAHYLSHLMIHSGERPFSCPVCSKTYTRNSHVTSHMRVHKKKSI